MQVLRDPQIISGFIYDEPVAEHPVLTHCGEALCSRGHALAPHSHGGFEFLYLSRGEASWRSGGHLYRQGIGELFVALPNESHATGPKANSENQHVWMGLKLDEMGAEAAALARQLRSADSRLISDCHEVEPLMRAIVSQVVSLRPRRTAVIRSLIKSFIALVGQRLEIAGGNPGPPARQLPYSPGVQKALAYMRQHLDHRVPLSDFTAAATSRSTAHFCTQFHREVGVSPSAYHAGLRLEAARLALSQPTYDVTTAALQYGFSSSQHFSTRFKEAYGLSPMAWKSGAHSPTTRSKRS